MKHKLEDHSILVVVLIGVLCMGATAPQLLAQRERGEVRRVLQTYPLILYLLPYI
jgi:hypothetical protein